MSNFRQGLIRADFETYRDLTWVETFELRLRKQGVDAEALKAFREIWNEQMEERDWEYWRGEARKLSDAELDDQRMDCVEKLDALGCLQWKEESQGKETFERLLNGSVDGGQTPQEQKRENGIEMG